MQVNYTIEERVLKKAFKPKTKSIPTVANDFAKL